VFHLFLFGSPPSSSTFLRANSRSVTPALTLSTATKETLHLLVVVRRREGPTVEGF